MAVEVYRVMFVNQVAVNINTIYSCLDIEMFKNFIHFIDWWLCRSHSAALPEWLGWNFPPLRAQSNVQYTKLKEQNYSYSVFDIRAIWHFCAFFLLLRRGATERYSKQKKRSTSINYSLILQFRPIPIPGSFSFQMLFCASTLTVLIISPLTAHDTSTVTNGSELDIGDPQLGQRLEPKMLATEIYRELRYCRPFGSASLIYLDWRISMIFMFYDFLNFPLSSSSWGIRQTNLIPRSSSHPPRTSTELLFKYSQVIPGI